MFNRNDMSYSVWVSNFKLEDFLWKWSLSSGVFGLLHRKKTFTGTPHVMQMRHCIFGIFLSTGINLLLNMSGVLLFLLALFNQFYQ